MPKVKKDPYRELTEEITGAITGAMGERRERQKDIARIMQKSVSQVSRDLKNIDSLSLGEFRHLVNHLGYEIQLVRGDK